MSSIVIALPKIEDARKIRSVLERHGFAVASVCSTASNALSSASELGSGVLICGHRLPDMNYLPWKTNLLWLTGISRGAGSHTIV